MDSLWENRVSTHIQFLKQIATKEECFNSQTLPAMIDLYCKMMPLVAKYGSQRIWMPLEVAWIAHCHLLHPIEYMRDCTRSFGHLVLFNPNATQLDSQETKNLFQDFYGVKFEDASQICTTLFVPSKDLVVAAMNQKTFTNQILQFPAHFDVQHCVSNYYKFIGCVRKALEMDPNSPYTFVPTLEIDLIWHTHMRYPNEYLQFVKKETGFLLNHEDDNPDLEKEFKETADFWRNEYAEEYTGYSKAECCSTVMTEKAKCCSAPLMTEKANCCSAPLMTEKAKCCSAPLMTEKANCCSAPLMTEKAKCCSAPLMNQKANCCSAPLMTEKAKCCSAPLMTEKANCCSAPLMNQKAECCNTANKNSTCTILAVKDAFDIPKIVVY